MENQTYPMLSPQEKALLERQGLKGSDPENLLALESYLAELLQKHPDVDHSKVLEEVGQAWQGRIGRVRNLATPKLIATKLLQRNTKATKKQNLKIKGLGSISMKHAPPELLKDIQQKIKNKLKESLASTRD